MATQTPNYSLSVPELSDAADMTAYNENWNIIDEQLKKSEVATTVVKYYLEFNDYDFSLSFTNGQTGLQLFTDLSNDRRVEITAGKDGVSFYGLSACKLNNESHHTLNAVIDGIRHEWVLHSDGRITYAFRDHKYLGSDAVQTIREGDGFTVRFWRSGIAEAWGYIGLSVTTKFDESNNYCGATISEGIRFPAWAFIEAPIITVTPLGGGYPCVLLGSPTKDGADVVLKTEWEITNQTIWLNVHAVGQWKSGD